MNLIEREYTRTTMYASYMLKLDLTALFRKHKQNFIDAYLSDDGHEPVHKNCIYLRFKYDHSAIFTEYLEKFKENITFVEMYDLPNDEIMIVMKVPPLYLEDFKHFKKGEYSKINKRFVAQYFNPSDSRYLACFKREKLKKYLEQELGVELSDDAELDSIPDLREEIFRYNEQKVHESI